MNYVEPTIRLHRPAMPTMRVAQAPSFAPEPTLRLPARAKCLNCEAVLVGKFCHGCGQAAKTHARITIGAILHELPHQLFHLDHALPHTIFALLTRPGHAIREYLAGKRVKMYSPFTLLFMVSGLLGLALLTVKMNRIGIANEVSSSAASTSNAALTDAIMKYQSWVRLALLPIIAIGPTLVLRGRTGLRYGEHIVAAAMMTAGSAMIKLAFVPLQWLSFKITHGYLWGGIVVSAGELATTLYALWTYAQLQDDGKRKDAVLRWLRSIGALLVATLVFVASMIVVGVGIVVVTTLRHR